MSNPSNVYKWNVSDNEKALYCPSPYGSSRVNSFQLYIPTIMPLITLSKPTQTISSLSSACFINDNSCKPSIAKTIRTQNFKTVESFPNRSFRYPYFRYGDELMVEIFNNDVHNMRVSNKVDNSFDLP